MVGLLVEQAKSIIKSPVNLYQNFLATISLDVCSSFEQLFVFIEVSCKANIFLLQTVARRPS